MSKAELEAIMAGHPATSDYLGAPRITSGNSKGDLAFVVPPPEPTQE